MIHIERYTPGMASTWDSFVGGSRTPTLLHLRSYMDYHADRFADHSLMAYAGNRLIAILPACLEDHTLYSHKGLTFGGWIESRRHTSAGTILDVWQATVERLRNEGIKKIVYAPAPYIYDIYPSDDDIYALFRLGARLTGCNASSAIPLSEPILLNETTRQAVKKASEAGIKVALSNDTDGFHDMLSKVLDERHSVIPVHTAGELRLLHSAMPGKIKLIIAYDTAGNAIAGTIVYLSEKVAHTQYMATTQSGRDLNALPYLIAQIPEILDLRPGMYLDFGSSCTGKGRNLNSGLDMKKAGMGGRTITYSTYTLDIG